MMKKMLLILTAVLLVLSLFSACGKSDGSELIDSSPDGLETFGDQIDPSAQPQTGNVLPNAPQEGQPGTQTDPDAQATQPGGIAGQDDVQTSSAPSPSKAPVTQSPKPSQPAVSEKPDDPEVSPEPPVDPSEADREAAEAYIGKPLTDLIKELGYPVRSEYDYIDENDPEAGQIGTLYYKHFTLTTKEKNGEEEIITAVGASQIPD